MLTTQEKEKKNKNIYLMLNFLQNKYIKAIIVAKRNSRHISETPTYRLELPFFENLGQDEATQRHRHDEDEGERQRDHGGLDDPQGGDARQLCHGEHVHAPCLHLKWHKCVGYPLINNTDSDKADCRG